MARLAEDQDAPLPPDTDPWPPHEDHEDEAAPKARTPWWLKTLIVAAAIVIVVSGGAVAALYGLSARYEAKVQREDILADVPTVEVTENEPMNFLMLGSDSREGKDAEEIDETGSRSDTIMLVHINKDRTGAFIVSIPRDSYVDIPAAGPWKGGKNKINAALAFGGANLAAKTVYNLTQVPLNGAMIVNFQGIRRMVEAVGGVEVCTPFRVETRGGRVWEKGCHQMTPADTEEFVRQRHLVAGGDFGRIKSQQNVIKGLMKKATSAGILTNPLKLDSLVSAVAESLTVDAGLDLQALAFDLKGIRAENVKFATLPYRGTMQTEHGSSVELDMARAETLFQALRDDTTDAWLLANPQPEVASFGP